MNEIEEITWRELTGNKFRVALHPAMLAKGGYTKRLGARKIGDMTKTMFDVTYDREYVATWIAKGLCARLFSLGKKGIVELVEKAWDDTYPNATEKAVTFLNDN